MIERIHSLAWRSQRSGPMLRKPAVNHSPLTSGRVTSVTTLSSVCSHSDTSRRMWMLIASANGIRGPIPMPSDGPTVLPPSAPIMYFARAVHVVSVSRSRTVAQTPPESWPNSSTSWWKSARPGVRASTYSRTLGSSRFCWKFPCR